MNRSAILILALAMAGVSPRAGAQSVELEFEPGAFQEQNVHVTQPGDTLFDLARRYMGDSLAWPRLWSFNPQITNPHWIYPGDFVFVRPPAEPVRQGQERLGRFFPLAGFYTGTEYTRVGEIRFADTGRRLLQPLDRIYLEFDDPESIRVGDRYAINRVVDRIYDEDDELVALEYLVTGLVQVTGFHSETDLVSAEVVQLWDTIERGDVLFIDMPQLVEVAPRVNRVDLEGRIIDHFRPVNHMHEQDYVFINRGYEDGVEVGNRFLIWDRQDEGALLDTLRNRGYDYEEDVRDRLPWEVAGEAMVIFVSDRYATAVVTDAGMRELVDNMRVTMEAGF